jgi:hypothetical protein
MIHPNNTPLLHTPSLHHSITPTLRSAYAPDKPQASSSSSRFGEGLPHPVNASRFGIPRERKNRSQASEILWMVTLWFGWARLGKTLIFLVRRIRLVDPLLRRILRSEKGSSK